MRELGQHWTVVIVRRWFPLRKAVWPNWDGLKFVDPVKGIGVDVISWADRIIPSLLVVLQCLMPQFHTT